MKTRTITINPVTRLEGHGKVTIRLNADGELEEARFHVTQFRGFEKFCQGRPFEEMPAITQRICGICPVSHQLASAKACDAILGITIPGPARMLRELLHFGQFIQSHALHFFHLASPDLLLGWDSDPSGRNVAGVATRFPEIALKGIRLRKFGQQIIEALGKRKIHPAFAVPGGVAASLSGADRDALLKGFSEAYGTAAVALDIIKDWTEKNREEVKTFAGFASLYAGLADPEGHPALYEGKMRLVDPERSLIREFDAPDYLRFIGEHVEPWSYMKIPFYRPYGYPDGCYRVGPLARLNAADSMDTPRAEAERRLFRQAYPDEWAGCTLLYHFARLIELLHCLEKADALLNDDRILDHDIRITADVKHPEGVGMIEAPRGTLIHHYTVDACGALEKVNLIVATGHNNIAMNRSIELVARQYIRQGEVREGLLNRVEGAIRCYDPCLSCATHAVGQMALEIRILDHSGGTVQRLSRA